MGARSETRTRRHSRTTREARATCACGAERGVELRRERAGCRRRRGGEGGEREREKRGEGGGATHHKAGRPAPNVAAPGETLARLGSRMSNRFGKTSEPLQAGSSETKTHGALPSLDSLRAQRTADGKCKDASRNTREECVQRETKRALHDQLVLAWAENTAPKKLPPITWLENAEEVLEKAIPLHKDGLRQGIRETCEAIRKKLKDDPEATRVGTREYLMLKMVEAYLAGSEETKKQIDKIEERFRIFKEAYEGAMGVVDSETLSNTHKQGDKTTTSGMVDGILAVRAKLDSVVGETDALKRKIDTWLTEHV